MFDRLFQIEHRMFGESIELAMNLLLELCMSIFVVFSVHLNQLRVTRNFRRSTFRQFLCLLLIFWNISTDKYQCLTYKKE